MIEIIELPDPREVDELLARLKATSPDFYGLLERYRVPAPALRHLGLIEWQNGRLDGAIDAFKSALSITPGDADLWRDLAGVFESSLDHERADRCVRNSIELAPAVARSWLLLANLRNQQGRWAEAEVAFGQALSCDSTLADAHFGLGLVFFAQRRVDEAAASLRTAIGLGYENALAFTTLAHVLYLIGDHAGCAASFERAMRFGPLETAAQRKYLRARMFERMSALRVDEALADFHALAGPDPENLDDILRDGFAVLSAFGHRDAAIAVGLRRLAQKPDDLTQRYLLDAVRGVPLTVAPPEYIESHFDAFAEKFDRQLVEVLRYGVPEAMSGLVDRYRRRFSQTLDLGCGTGLAAKHLARFGGRLVGVDLSARMLEKAAERGLYSELVKAEATAFLAERRRRFDLVFAADFAIYVGDLAELFMHLARSVADGGLLALSIETTRQDDFVLLSSGRFAHSPGYIRRLAAANFETLAEQPTMIRLEANRPVDGMLFVLRRRVVAPDRQVVPGLP